MINILNIPRQHFFVYDRRRHDAAVYGARHLDTLRGDDTESNRLVLRDEYLSPVVGFRQAERLYTAPLGELKDVFAEHAAKQARMKSYLESRFSEAARKAAKRRPEGFAKREVVRDAAFYTLTRSGIAAIAEAAGENADWERAATELANGERLKEKLRNDVVREALELMPSALLFADRRRELYGQLEAMGMDAASMEKIMATMPETIDFRSFGISEEQKPAVRSFLERYRSAGEGFDAGFERLSGSLDLDAAARRTLRKRLQKIVSGSLYTLSQGVEELQQGRADERVLSRTYRTGRFLSYYPLGSELSMLGLRKYDVDHVHTIVAGCTENAIKCLQGDAGMPTKVVRDIQAEKATRWSGKRINLLDPAIEVSNGTAGNYVGHFLFGHGKSPHHSVAYALRSMTRGQFFDLLETTGILDKEPCLLETSGEDLAGKFGISLSSNRSYNSYLVPAQFVHLARASLSEWKEHGNEAIARNALLTWLEERSWRAGQGRRARFASVKPEYQDVMRDMASAVGLNIGSGKRFNNKIHVYVSNPEQVGFVPVESPETMMETPDN